MGKGEERHSPDLCNRAVLIWKTNLLSYEQPAALNEYARFGFLLGSSHLIPYCFNNCLSLGGVSMFFSIDKAFTKAESHIKMGELVEAKELYRKVLSKFPQNKKPYKGNKD